MATARNNVLPTAGYSAWGWEGRSVYVYPLPSMRSVAVGKQKRKEGSLSHPPPNAPGKAWCGSNILCVQRPALAGT